MKTLALCILSAGLMLGQYTFPPASGGGGGTPGAPGAAGYSPVYIVAAGVPASGTGNNGDMYINSTTGDVYGPRTAGAWGSIVANIKGPSGPAPTCNQNTVLAGPGTGGAGTAGCRALIAGDIPSTLAAGTSIQNASLPKLVTSGSAITANTLLVQTGSGSTATYSTATSGACSPIVALTTASAAGQTFQVMNNPGTEAQVAMDNTAVLGDLVGCSTTGGQAHDLGASATSGVPSTTSIIGKITATGNPATIRLHSAGAFGSGSIAGLAANAFTGTQTIGGAGGNAINFQDGTTPANGVNLVNPSGRSALGNYTMFGSDPSSGYPQCPTWSGASGSYLFAGWAPCFAQSTVNPAALTTNVTDYSPGASATKVNLTATTAVTISGIQAGLVDGQQVVYCNLSSSAADVISFLTNAGSTGNQIVNPAGVNLLQYSCVTFVYDLPNAVWRVPNSNRIPVSQGGTGGLPSAAYSLVSSGSSTAAPFIYATPISTGFSFPVGNGSGNAITFVSPEIAFGELVSGSNLFVAATAGTTQYYLVKMFGSQLVTTAAGDTYEYGVAQSTSATGVLSIPARYGSYPIVSDMTTTAGNWAIMSATAGEITDSGQNSDQNIPKTTQIVGRIRTASTGAGTTSLVELTPEHYGNQLPVSFYSCGTSAVCSNTISTLGRHIFGHAPLASGSPSTVTISGISPAFTSSASYYCTFGPEGSVPASVSWTRVSSSSFTITGPNTSTIVVDFSCDGN